MDSFVTLIVKAPNQQIEDQTIKCEITWTIRKLKQHLSEVYPSKPPKHEQKLIYSGQLLNDSVTLKDILRQYEGQETHTVHLVCASKYIKTVPDAQPVAQSTPPAQPQNADETPPPAAPQPTDAGPSRPTEGPTNAPFFNLNNGNIDANQYAMQMAWMQQAYFQYMAQYMQLAANSYGAAGQPAATPAEAGDAQHRQPAPEEAAAAAAAGPAAARDPDVNPERDWLEVFYMLTRATVLFIVIYFYSSPVRFLFVLLLGAGLYLYQIGFFRNMNNNNNNVEGAPRGGGTAAGEEEGDRAPSRFMIVWTFFATFFASLIPEIPNAI
ncbi:unnamed protein product [Phyllotreta striolata]|uniref:Ubiquitin-like domain-containing protein n=1 Tax=Phyllotreta striolata TaxID=444603 RepID=A0A9N9XTC3_PHYSR|nr:unnamed protein product [Phyllotreta striolata]